MLQRSASLLGSLLARSTALSRRGVPGCGTALPWQSVQLKHDSASTAQFHEVVDQTRDKLRALHASIDTTAISQRIQQLTERLSASNVWDNPGNATRFAQEKAQLCSTQEGLAKLESDFKAIQELHGMQSTQNGCYQRCSAYQAAAVGMFTTRE